LGSKIGNELSEWRFLSGKIKKPHENIYKHKHLKFIMVKRGSVSSGKKMSAREREELLIENFVGLQKAMTTLSVRFGDLSDNISK